MANINIYTNIVIALLGLAYPILLQIIAKLDEKYESEEITELFKKEFEWKAFQCTLVVSLVLIFIWSFQFEPLISNEKLNFIIENSATLFVILSTISLIISFGFFVKKVFTYYNLYDFIPYQIKKHNKIENNEKHFRVLSVLLLLSIRRQQTNITITLSNFFYTTFRQIRDKYTNEPVVYPDLYYETVYKTIEELAILKEKRNYLLEQRTAGGIWLLCELQGKEISEITYLWLWRNLLLGIRYQQDDLIIYHWETCDQYYALNFTYNLLGTNYLAGNSQVNNEERGKKRIAEKKRFIEFHYALGGLLIYKERYVCLKRLFDYTRSQPPKYELLPESMSQIFIFYFDIIDPHEIKHTNINGRYPFPELSGLKSDFIIKKWISSYMAVLFLRQYLIYPYFTTIQPLDFPRTPDTQGEIKQWIDRLDFFKNLVSEHLQNKELLKILKLDFITKEWCANNNNKPYPITFIEDFKAKLNEDYNRNALTLEISSDKVLMFEESTKKIIESTYKELQSISNKGALIEDDNSDKWDVIGQTMHQNKDAFSLNPEVSYINFDSFLATIASKSMNEGLSETFFYKKTKLFLLKPEVFFKAIDKLAIDESFIIVNFGIDLNYFINHLKIVELSENKYKNIDIYSFSGSQLVNDSLFILKKSDLPNISTKPIKEDIISKYKLKRISNKITLYSSVIDLNNTSEEVYNENKRYMSDDELKKSVLLCIIFLLEFKWEKNIEVIQLKQYSEFHQNGIANKLEEVKPINKEK